jgi:hypothetical protein
LLAGSCRRGERASPIPWRLARGENEEARLADRRNALDLQINMVAEQESTQTLRMQQQIGQRLGVSFENHPGIAALKQTTVRRCSLRRSIE